ncbi:Branched-chain-amino-acid aminotransferase,mitochondrial [Wickerhamomyces ciferrii]|uniref:Branched-chain-amino-acid aminotransferase n=1 Tax=Wickerhamomyces ciferrii (strain ATCC 14091 / BCRC 22168 / CBS 111 / JCM 3599 / NBRC 0793 / NRRL Y-1031 F-60-10) TaxID=1206466 RepID=K0KC83_WICCF|nr:Branched-chain-amino-acid aminotransferase,mitochondrial [Wickerhamomyces ciferrii]CCH40506.1 Branched-chain-amino-acid aminotransferase,mitochondrial [Wickerhamomyces ciferrii]
MSSKLAQTYTSASNWAKLTASKLQITKNPNPKQPLPNDKLVFGQSFTDHMVQIKWNDKEGWASPQIVPYGPLSLDPSAAVFHYAFELFEGMKAYRDSNDQIRLFRPDKNMIRMNQSAERIVLPAFDGEELIKVISELIKLDKHLIPKEKGYSLYIRPTLIGTTPGLGVNTPTEALLYVITCPVGPYYSTGFKAVRLEATDHVTRAWPGGVGDKKLGVNYAPSVKPQLEAAERGYQQNLWLFGEEKTITEVGTMNVFFVFKDSTTGKKELVTAPLDGTILPGVTRDSILALTRDRLDSNEWEVNERYTTIYEVAEKSKKGELVEAFGSGTAAVVSPIKEIAFNGESINVPLLEGEQFGELTGTVAQWISKIQYGDEEYKNWSRVVADLK